MIIGEVWEDGSTKVAYGVRRRHIMGRHCDGLMNYPFRNAVLSYLKGGDAADFVNAMETLRENYPRFAYYSAMNSLGTHDTARILTLLGAEEGCEHQSKEWRSNYRLGPDQRRRAKELLKLGAALMFAFPGSPTVYYGDEAGSLGGRMVLFYRRRRSTRAAVRLKPSWMTATITMMSTKVMFIIAPS